MSVYVTDTHPLIWYATGKHNQLSKKALKVFNAAMRAEALIYVPAFVLWEIAMLMKIGRIVLSDSYEGWTEKLVALHGFDLATINVQILSEAYAYPFNDPFDGVITATATVLALPLITKDQEITRSKKAEIYW